MFDLEKLSQLSPEQLLIAKKWEQESLERIACLNAMKAAEDDEDPLAYKECWDKYRSLIKDKCEHDRSIWSSCSACQEIEEILFPEKFEDEDDFEDE